MGTFSGNRDSPALRGDLQEAPIIVAVGRGVKDREGLNLMVAFAEAIGAQVAGTRGAADEGWIPHSREIGLSGQRVRPRLYIACGISGANFHTLGMEHSEYIIAVNTDPSARIFQLADLCITEDAAASIREVLHRLEHVKGKLSAAQIISLFEMPVDVQG